ncbi:STAS-like domain-containing protein [Achromobacter sp. NPDC058515]|uniref:STAS-like domain-containing protein n=1 Tax=Achromobacter sp. NPDC058515 TaxID=3346533 RepID=UPI003668B5F2
MTRYQAKRVLNAVPQGARHVCFDFSGVGSIGPAFADEIFFIYVRQNPGVEIAWAGAAAIVKSHILWASSRAQKYGSKIPAALSQP